MLTGLGLMGWAFAGSYQVHGVDPGDVLYVRERPEATAPIVGAIPPNGTGVYVEGTEGGWSRVTYREFSGWANATYLTQGSAPSYKLPSELTCSGTEPFWGLKLKGTTATLEGPDIRTVTARLSSPIQPSMRLDTWLLEGAPKQGLRFVLLQQTGQCSDGMSDLIYPYEVVVRTPAGLLSGCCRLPQ